MLTSSSRSKPRKSPESRQVRHGNFHQNLLGRDRSGCCSGPAKKTKLEHDQQLEAPTEAKRLQAEADADIAVLSNVVLPQLQAAAQKLHPLGGKVEIRQYGRTGKTLRPASIAFRITDQQDQQDQPGYGKGHQSRAYLIVPRGGVVRSPAATVST
jgi:hypothetical protein